MFLEHLRFASNTRENLLANVFSPMSISAKVPEGHSVDPIYMPFNKALKGIVGIRFTKFCE